MDEIKALADYQLEKCSIHPFSKRLGESLDFTSWWKNMANNVFCQDAKKALSCFELNETSGVMPTTRIISELYNDIVAIQDFYGI